MKRIFFDIILFICIFVFPWWIVITFSVVGIFIFKNYYEFLISCIIIEVLSTTKTQNIHSKSFLVYLAIVIFYLFIQYLHDHILLYKNQNEIPYK